MKKTNEKHDWNEKLILIAEDVDTNYLFLKAALKKTGVNILWAKNGSEAVEHVTTNNKIDLVLMDIQMPVLNGCQATRMIKTMKKDIPVIAQTAYAMTKEKEHILKSGCDEYLTKPIMPGFLIRTLSKYLETQA